jgi:sulfite reductase alpha subunit-like flavoprotein
MNESRKKKVEIIYTSETGTSEDAAYSFYRRLIADNPEKLEISLKNSDKVKSYDYFLNGCPLDAIYLFYLSTTGDGEVPKSFKLLWSSLLRKNLPCDLFKAMKFAVFGFGDSSYEKYNACARKFFVRMTQLGAFPILEIGLGDDQAAFGYFQSLNSFESRFLSFCRIFHAAVENTDLSDPSLPLPPPTTQPLSPLEPSFPPLPASASSLAPFSMTLLPSIDYGNMYKVTVISPPFLERNEHESDQHLITFSEAVCEQRNDNDCLICQILRNDRLTASDWFQDIRLIRLQTLPSSSSFSSFDYESGDVAVVYYKNDKDLVQRAISYFFPFFPRVSSSSSSSSLSSVKIRIGSLSSSVGTSPSSSRISCVNEMSLVAFFEEYLELGGIPKPSFFSLLASFLPSSASSSSSSSSFSPPCFETAAIQETKEKLLELSSSSGIDLYYQYCYREKRNFIDILEEFPLCEVPLNAFLEICPKLIPRKYSIASSPSVSSSTAFATFELCIAVVEYLTPYKRKKYGMSTKYLSSLLRSPQQLPAAIGLSTSLPVPSSPDSSKAQDDRSILKIRIEKGIINNDGRRVIKQKYLKQNQPVIMIGTGTGIAPIRSLIYDLLASHPSHPTQHSSNSCSPSPLILLLFGCRKATKDYLFHEEWSLLEKQLRSRRESSSENRSEQETKVKDKKENDEVQGILSCSFHVKVAFSQDTLIKRYVTTLIKENSHLLWTLLQQVCMFPLLVFASTMISFSSPSLEGSFSFHFRKCKTNAKRCQENFDL